MHPALPLRIEPFPSAGKALGGALAMKSRPDTAITARSTTAKVVVAVAQVVVAVEEVVVVLLHDRHIDHSTARIRRLSPLAEADFVH